MSVWQQFAWHGAGCEQAKVFRLLLLPQSHHIRRTIRTQTLPQHQLGSNSASMNKPITSRLSVDLRILLRMWVTKGILALTSKMIVLWQSFIFPWVSVPKLLASGRAYSHHRSKPLTIWLSSARTLNNMSRIWINPGLPLKTLPKLLIREQIEVTILSWHQNHKGRSMNVRSKELYGSPRARMSAASI